MDIWYLPVIAMAITREKSDRYQHSTEYEAEVADTEEMWSSSSSGGDAVVSARETESSVSLNNVDLDLRLTLVAVQAYVPMLLLLHPGKRPALHAGWWLLNTALCMVTAKALEAVRTWIRPGDEAGAERTCAKLLNWCLHLWRDRKQWAKDKGQKEKKDS